MRPPHARAHTGVSGGQGPGRGPRPASPALRVAEGYWETPGEDSLLNTHFILQDLDCRKAAKVAHSCHLPSLGSCQHLIPTEHSSQQGSQHHDSAITSPSPTGLSIHALFCLRAAGCGGSMDASRKAAGTPVLRQLGRERAGLHSGPLAGRPLHPWRAKPGAQHSWARGLLSGETQVVPAHRGGRAKSQGVSTLSASHVVGEFQFGKKKASRSRAQVGNSYHSV